MTFDIGVAVLNLEKLFGLLGKRPLQLKKEVGSELVALKQKIMLCWGNGGGDS